MYLGERVARHHSSDIFVVPAPPPRHMFDERELSSMAEESGSLWRSHVILGRSYAEELLPLLAPAPVPAEDVRVRSLTFVFR